MEVGKATTCSRFTPRRISARVASMATPDTSRGTASMQPSVMARALRRAGGYSHDSSLSQRGACGLVPADKRAALPFAQAAKPADSRCGSYSPRRCDTRPQTGPRGVERNGNQHAESRLDRHGPHGLSHGRAAAQGRLRGLDLEPHARQGRAAGHAGRQDRRQALAISPASTCCSRSSRPARI